MDTDDLRVFRYQALSQPHMPQTVVHDIRGDSNGSDSKTEFTAEKL